MFKVNHQLRKLWKGEITQFSMGDVRFTHAICGCHIINDDEGEYFIEIGYECRNSVELTWKKDPAIAQSVRAPVL